jgi:rubrerythrin
MSPRDQLIRLLQNAYSGELAAWHAYEGHRKSVGSLEAQEILVIRDDEKVHRECVGNFLAQLDARPRKARELRMLLTGLIIRGLCRIGGWFIPMYGAGRLERGNISEYEVAARLAYQAGCPQMIESLLHMAEVEWDHEAYFRKKAESHFLARWIPLWDKPSNREMIRNTFAAEYPKGTLIHAGSLSEQKVKGE